MNLRKPAYTIGLLLLSGIIAEADDQQIALAEYQANLNVPVYQNVDAIIVMAERVNQYLKADEAAEYWQNQRDQVGWIIVYLAENSQDKAASIDKLNKIKETFQGKTLPYYICLDGDRSRMIDFYAKKSPNLYISDGILSEKHVEYMVDVAIKKINEK